MRAWQRVAGEVLASLLLVVASATTVSGQATPADGPVLGAARMSAVGSVKLFIATGSVRVIGWDRDSIVVRGRVRQRRKFYFSVIPEGAKLGIEEASDDSVHVPCDCVIYIPRRATLSAKTMNANVRARDVSGWIYTISGTVEVTGSSSSIEVQSMTGSVDAGVTTPWIKVSTGGGNVLLRGAPEDADVTTISGSVSIESSAIVRGQFASVTGDIHYFGAPSAGGIFELTSHSGSVDIAVPETASAVFALSSVTGLIVNGLRQVRPAAAGPHSLRLSVGRGEAQVTVRTFKGTIRLRAK